MNTITGIGMFLLVTTLIIVTSLIVANFLEDKFDYEHGVTFIISFFTLLSIILIITGLII